VTIRINYAATDSTHSGSNCPDLQNRRGKGSVQGTAKDLKAQLVKANLRVHLDEREGFSPGWKFNDWEMRGVPVRVELGPKDVAKQSAMLARRDRPGREGKVSASLADSQPQSKNCLWKSPSLFDKALAFRRANTHETTTYDELKKAVESGFAFALWCGSGDCEAKSGGNRAPCACIPIDQTAVMGKEVQMQRLGCWFAVVLADRLSNAPEDARFFAVSRNIRKRRCFDFLSITAV